MSEEAERERARYEALAALVDNYRRERDDAREQLYLTKAELGRWVDRETKVARERDEARAEVEKLSESAKAAWDAECVMREQRDRYYAEWKQERQEVERLRSWIYRTRKDTQADPDEELTDDPAALLDSMFYEIVDSRNAYRRGAEAMREACAQWVDHWASEVLAEKMRALPIPEEP